GEYLPPKEENLTFKEMAKAYLEWYLRTSQAGEHAKKEHERKVSLLVDFFKDMPVHRISTFTIEQYKRHREENSKASSVSIDKELMVIHAIFSKGKELGLYKGEIPRIPYYRAKAREIVRFLTPEEAQKLLSACPLHLKRIVLFVLNTGCRANEALSLKWEDVDFKTGCLRIHASQTKTKTHYTILMNSTVRELLEDIKKEQEEKGLKTDYVFLNSQGKPYGRQGYRRAFKNACKKAGLQDFRFHDLRHTFASWVAMKTKDIYLVQRLLNHQKIDTTKRYAHLTQEYMVNALEEISSVFRQEKEEKPSSA
ncbi:MAG: tyrosine-type recombinase/integrase, partial [Aquificaceae bacterium]